MTNYYVGYDNKPWDPMNDFVIMAETRNKGVAETIQKSYNEKYEKAGFSVRLIIATEKEIKNYRYA